jgi:putative heme-binding domain-containing protein
MARGLESRKDWAEGIRTAVGGLLKHRSSRVQRAAVEAVTFHPHADFVAPLVELLKKCPPDDTHLRYAARVALRNCLRDLDKPWANVVRASDPVIGDVALAIASEKAATYLLFQIRNKSILGNKLAAAAEHVARYGRPRDEEALLRSLTSVQSGPDPAPVLAAFRGVQARGARLTQEASGYILEIAAQRIMSADAHDPVQTKGLVAGLRFLSALPAVVDQTLMATALGPQSKLVDALERLVAGATVPPDVRVDAAEVLLRYSPDGGLRALRKQLANPDAPSDLRDRLLIVFASSAVKDARLDARDALKDAPYRTAVAVGTALAGSPAGAEDLLDAVKQGKAPARLLQEKVILERLRAANIPNLNRQIGALTKGLPPLDQKIAELMNRRAVAFASAKPDKEMGLKVFTKHCGACHKIGEAGGKIAPQLDGVGNRGLERVLEDVLDPNRNVDQAFRARIITTKDERTITGLMLRVEGEVVVVADAEGKEVRIPTKEIESNRETMLSPMPANFGDAIPEADFNHLLAYLLDQRAKEPSKK